MAIERALMRIRRSQTRRTLGRLATRDLGQDVNLAQLDEVFAVDEGPARPGEELTVGLVAERLGIDPSRASRMVGGLSGPAGYGVWPLRPAGAASTSS